MKKLSPSRLADTVARLRREKSMTQAQLADATGINRALISRLSSMILFLLLNNWNISEKFSLLILQSCLPIAVLKILPLPPL